jgi:hypothetical protein
MPVLTIGKQKVNVGDEFLRLSPEQQQSTVDEIADSLGINGPGAPDLSAGRTAGLTARAGVQAAPGAALGLPALAYDAVQQAANWGYQGIDALAGTDLAGRHRRSWGGPMGTTQNLGRLGEYAADAMGLPKPQTEDERVAVSAGQTALEALGGAGLAKAGAKTVSGVTKSVLDDLAEAPVTQGSIAAAAGGGAQIAAENDVHPILGMAGGMAAGLGGVAAAHGTRSGLQGARRMADNALLRTDEARRSAADEVIRRSASDPGAALREIDEGAGGELVPGSRPTTFQATGDMGLGSLERRLQTENPDVFAGRRGEQNAARLSSLHAVGGEGEADQIVSFLRGQLDEIDRVTLGYETKARSAAEEAAERIRPADDAEGLGRSARGSMRDAEETARRQERALWSAIDPDGTLLAASQSTREAAHRIYGTLTRSARLGLSTEEKAYSDLISQFDAMVPFQEMVDLASQVKSAARKELRTGGRTPSYYRLADLSQAIRNGMEQSATVRITEDPGVRDRLRRDLHDFKDRPRSFTGAASGRREAAAGGASPFPPISGDEVPSVRGLRNAPGNPGLQGSAQPNSRPLSLTEYIARNGGIELTPDARHLGWDQVKVGGARLARPGGKPIDGHWRHELREAGYLRRDPDGHHTSSIDNELYELIDRETKGRGKAYSALDETRAAPSAPNGLEAEVRSAERQIREGLKASGISPQDISTRALADAAERLARGEETSALDAYERAVMSLDDEGPVRATYTPNDRPSAGSALEGFRDDPDAGRRYRAATDASRARATTFNRGYAGQILRHGDDRQSYRMGDASVAANLFRPGPTGGERIKAAVKAGARLGDIAEIAAVSLHKAALRTDGTLDPARFNRWRTLHSDALRELPEYVRARFASASLASQALDRVAAARKERVDGLRKSVLGKVAGTDPDDLSKVIGGVLNAKDATARMGQLVAASRKAPDAREGLRRAVAEYIEGHFISNKEVGVSGENGIRADAFQSFVKDKAPALRLIFSGEDLLRMQAIADDIRRAERSLYAVRTPGNSNTAADLQPALDRMAKEAGQGSLLSHLWKAGSLGWIVGDYRGAAVGTGGVVGKRLLGTMRRAGLRRVDDLVLEMMLDPQLAKAALMRTPKRPDTGSEQILAHLLARRSPLAVAAAADEGQP